MEDISCLIQKRYNNGPERRLYAFGGLQFALLKGWVGKVISCNCQQSPGDALDFICIYCWPYSPFGHLLNISNKVFEYILPGCGQTCQVIGILV